MHADPRVVVLFPGAWGNLAPKYLDFWMANPEKVFQRFFGNRVKVIKIVYSGASMDEIVQGAFVQLEREKVTSAIALGYSLGVSIMALACSRRPDLFTNCIKFQGDDDGIGWAGYLRGMSALLIPFVIALFTGWMRITSKRAVRRVFFTGERLQDATENQVDLVMTHLCPNAIYPLLELAFPPMKKRIPSIHIPSASIIGGKDIFYRKVRERPDQKVYSFPNWGHGAILEYAFAKQAIWNALIDFGFIPKTTDESTQH